MQEQARSPHSLTVVQCLPTLDMGGAEQSTLEIAEALLREGHRAVVVSAGGTLVRALTDMGAEHVVLDIGRKSPRTLFKALALRRLLKRLRPDIVHVRSRLPAWMVRLAALGLQPRARLVATVHGLNSPGLYSAIMTRADRVICVSRTVERYVLAHYPRVEPERLSVVPRGVDREKYAYGFKPAPSWLAQFQSDFPGMLDRPLLTLPARATRLKGHHDAIFLLEQLRTKHGLQANLLLLGAIDPTRSAYAAELKTLIAGLGLQNRVFFSAPRRDAREVMAISALVLQLSNKPESFGRTVIEALALGIPVLGYAHGGVGELLQELFPAGAVPLNDHDRLAAQAAAFLQKPPTVAEFPNYDVAHMQEKTMATYRKALEG